MPEPTPNGWIDRKTRYEFSHRGGDTYYWYSVTQLPGDSRTEQISCNVDWFWNRGDIAARAGERL